MHHVAPVERTSPFPHKTRWKYRERGKKKIFSPRIASLPLVPTSTLPQHRIPVRRSLNRSLSGGGARTRNGAAAFQPDFFMPNTKSRVESPPLLFLGNENDDVGVGRHRRRRHKRHPPRRRALRRRETGLLLSLGGQQRFCRVGRKRIEEGGGWYFLL